VIKRVWGEGGAVESKKKGKKKVRDNARRK
jgi:hypothetical protein